jgi:NAD(P)-dependent dehydrogenase (short-subunit alcohol dehydrogenase family)
MAEVLAVNNVAVITGAASGIGWALAKRCASQRMRVVLADKNAAALSATAAEIRASGVEVLAVPTDVSRAHDMEVLAEAIRSTFGRVHLLCNNAGVGITTPILQSTIEDWEWALGVNLWSVIHGVRVFVPLMRSHQDPCHIVNTASIAGLISPPGLGVYRTTKHAVVAYSEALYHELAEQAPHIKISVLCPGIVKTQILSSAHRAQAMSGDVPAAERLDNTEEQRLKGAFQEGMAPEAVAELVFEAVREERFYILTHPERNWQIRDRMEDILLERNPTGTTTPHSPQNAHQEAEKEESYHGN